MPTPGSLASQLIPGLGTSTSRTPYQMSGITPIMCTSAVTVEPDLQMRAYAVPLLSDGTYWALLWSHRLKNEASATTLPPSMLLPPAAAVPVPIPSIDAAATPVAAAAATNRLKWLIAV